MHPTPASLALVATATAKRPADADAERDDSDGGAKHPRGTRDDHGDTAAAAPAAFDVEQAVHDISAGFEADAVRLEEHHERIVEAVDALFARLREELEAQQARRGAEYQAQLDAVVQAEQRAEHLRERLQRFLQLLQDGFDNLLRDDDAPAATSA